jgi:hypothetical protein
VTPAGLSEGKEGEFLTVHRFRYSVRDFSCVSAAIRVTVAMAAEGLKRNASSQ